MTTCEETKEAVLKAAREALKSYTDKKHVLSMQSCHICLLARLGSNFSYDSPCNLCIMLPFDNSKTDTVFCCNRKCAPCDCGDQLTRNRLRKVKLFWRNIIKLLESTPSEKFSNGWINSEWWNFCIRGCDEVAFNSIE